MKPRIAVLLAAFNGARWLQEQVDTILFQEDVEVNIFINVDISSDGTEKLVSQLVKGDARIHALPFGIHYGGAAPNFYQLIKTVDFSAYDFVALSDQDDIWLPKKLITATSTIEKFNAVAYSSNVIAFWQDGKKMLIDKSQKQTNWDFLFEAAGPGCTYVLKHDLALCLQIFLMANWKSVHEIDLHDWFIYAFARSTNCHWHIDPNPSLFYRQHDNNQIGANTGFRARLLRFRKILNGWWLGQSLLIAKILGLKDDAFIKSWSNGHRIGYLTLGFHFRECRRRIRDKFLFLVACLCLAIYKLPIKK